MKYLPDVYIRHLALLVGGLFRLLKESITPEDREKSASFLKLFCAQAASLYGMSLSGLFKKKIFCNINQFRLEAS